MRDVKIDTNDFDLSFKLNEDESVAIVNHLILDEEHQYLQLV
jgi:hypothetical protein